MQLYTAEGPQVVRDLVTSGREVFLDLKYHDIPNTVGAAVAEAAMLGVSMLTVHGAGGSKMLKAAVDAAKQRPGMMVLAITVLTSLDANELENIGLRGGVEETVVRLARIALVTPGVRPAGSSVGDQVRVVTPAEAVAAGASHIVVGRPITDAADPAAAAQAILAQING
jgi:orotidine-5'-phosphate decarboxylase